ncbi:MAG TPA: epimerase [Bryobacteraceae bacterium]|jgi:uncharacterized protein YbjT (DUF2867 family)|nr:epimerase [Bryobacteraceae bacterium]
MNAILFGATGMVGQGVLRECVHAADVKTVLCIGRSPSGSTHVKVTDLVLQDLTDYSQVSVDLSGFDACFFCLGVSSSGMKEAEYSRITYSITIAAAETLARVNPGMTFIYVSGQGTDSSERGRVMWARVKGKTENALLRLPFHAYMLRPGVIEPLHGIQSRTKLYRVFYKVLRPALPLMKALFPNSVTTTEQIGRAMLEIARHGTDKKVLETRDINFL